MPFLVCENCNIYYEIHTTGELVELGNCKCGTKLRYFKSIEEYYEEIETSSLEEDEFFSYLYSSMESAVARIIIYCIQELSFPLGINKLIEVLRGSNTTFIIDYKIYPLDSYSSLSHLSKRRLTRYIQTLERRRILKTELVSKYNRPVISVTQEGMDFLKNDDNLSFRIYTKKSTDLMNGVDETLYRTLRQLRKDIAYERNIQAHRVCNNGSLLEMARQQPTNHDSMKAIKGIGKSFMKKYGDLFLNAII